MNKIKWGPRVKQFLHGFGGEGWGGGEMPESWRRQMAFPKWVWRLRKTGSAERHHAEARGLNGSKAWNGSFAGILEVLAGGFIKGGPPPYVGSYGTRGAIGPLFTSAFDYSLRRRLRGGFGLAGGLV